MDPRQDEADASFHLDLEARPSSAREARDGVRRTLTRWNLVHLIDVCQLVVSELVSNAVRHGWPPIGLGMRRGSDDLRMDVQDARPVDEGPVAARTDGLAEGGRGLAIVEAVSDGSGVESMDGDGKRVFARWHVGR